MNALGRTRFARFLREWPIPRPSAWLVVSAHWQTPAPRVTAGARPETIHDFYGFPRELHALTYPAPGEPTLARRVLDLLGAAGIGATADPTRGLDHGTWAPLLQIAPAADVPVVQLSLPAAFPDRLVEMGLALAPLRDEGVLIAGSGNLVHNLATADLSEEVLPVEPWAAAFDGWVADRLRAWDVAALATFAGAPEPRRAHPTLEHYAPLLVACGAAGTAPQVTFPFEGFEHATLSLRCVRMD